MRIYVASAVANHKVARALKQELRDAGHEITHDWTGSDHIFSIELDSSDDREAKCRAARDDIRGVRTADLVIYLAHERCFGANIELGMALAYGVHIYVVDPIRDSIFFELPGVTKIDLRSVRVTLGLEPAPASVTV